MGKLRSAKSSSNPLFGPQTTTEQCIGLFSSNDYFSEVVEDVSLLETLITAKVTKILLLSQIFSMFYFRASWLRTVAKVEFNYFGRILIWENHTRFVFEENLTHLVFKENTTRLVFEKKHRKNCECCPGHYLIVDHYSSF